MLLRRLSIFFLIAWAVPLQAQWVKTSGPDSVRAFGYGIVRPDATDLMLFAGTTHGIYRSGDDGVTWTAINGGLTNLSIRGIAVLRDTLYVATYGGGVFKSGNVGASWSAVNTGITNLNVRAILVYGTTLFVGADEGKIFRSDNRGASWNSIDLDSSTAPINALSYYSAGLQSGLYAATDEGLFTSTDEGQNWSSANSGLASLKVNTLLSGVISLYSATEVGIYLRSFVSLPPYPSWSKATMVTVASPAVLALASPGPYTEGITPKIAGTKGSGIFYSASDYVWTQVNEGLLEMDVQAVRYANEYCFAGTNGGIWRRRISEISAISNELKNTDLSPNFQVREDGSVFFELKNRSFVSVEVFDLKGEPVTKLVHGELEPGKHVGVKPQKMPNGLYVFQLRIGAVVENRKVIVRR